MKISLDRLSAFFTEPLHPPAAFLLTRTRIGGLVRSGKDGGISGQAVLPFAPGVLEPSFDKRNISNPAAFEKTVRAAGARVGRSGGPVGIMLPESCLKAFVLPFESLPSAPRERDEVLRWRLAKLVPLPPEDMRTSYAVFKSPGPPRVLISIARTDVVREYEEAFGRAGLAVRDIGVPALNLLGLVRLDPPGHALVLNLEEDYVSLTAVLDGQVALYRFKPVLQDPNGPQDPGLKIEQAAAEVETTIRFVEDREKRTIGAVWVRAAFPDSSGAAAALREQLPNLSVRDIEVPPSVRPPDRAFLAPLVGQGLS
jgi:hypothetical protein